MRKQIKKYGNSAVIVFDKEDRKSYNIKIGDIIDISDIVKIERKNKPARKIKRL